ncbi:MULTISPECIES: anti-sigma factor family protein [Actinosynnema]|uniref:Anti-sigma factor n=1 Tax=Actinosynnema pretiosum TaxID=42197 RepID=A0A290ZFR3_9PSEU|nr:hypothetical protein [Actinosynnema pretiosum]ATE57880.1 hypothetical protein CNX65_35000 [Actinosynnema pretiosum]
MTGNVRRPGPPWSVDLLADLHAGALTAQEEDELRARIADDAEAQEILAALDATLSDLGALSNLPVPRMPEDIAARLDDVIAAEQRSRVAQVGAPGIPQQTAVAPALPEAGYPAQRQLPAFAAPAAPRTAAHPPSNVVDLAARRRKRLGWGAGLLTAAAAVVGVAVVVAPQPGAGDNVVGQPSAAPTSASPGVPEVEGGNFGPVFGEVLAAKDYGQLESPEKLKQCLAGGGVTSTPVGFAPVRLDGRDAVMSILPGGKSGSWRVVVLDPKTCGPTNPEGVLADEVINR